MAEETEDLPVLKKNESGAYEAVYSQDDELPVLKKKEQTTPTTSPSESPSQSSAGGAPSTIESEGQQPQPSNPLEPSGQQPEKPKEKPEPIDLPKGYDRMNPSTYKKLVQGQRYKLMRGGVPVIGEWSGTEFIKEPLFDLEPKPKELGALERVFTTPIVSTGNLYETDEEVLARNLYKAQDAEEKLSETTAKLNAIATTPVLQEYNKLVKEAEQNPEVKQQVEKLAQTPLTEADIPAIRFEGGSEGKLFQNITPQIPTEEYEGKMMPVKLETLLPEGFKDIKTVGELYNAVNNEYENIELASNDINTFNNALQQARINKLPEEKKQYLESIKDTPYYAEEIDKALIDSGVEENVIMALGHGLSNKVEALSKLGSNLGLSDKELEEKMKSQIAYKQIFGKQPKGLPAEIAESVGGMIPDLAAGAMYSPLMVLSMLSTMPNDMMEQYYAEKLANGETPNKNEAWKFALTSTAAQAPLLMAAGGLGGAPMKFMGKTAFGRVGELAMEVSKRAGKDAVLFGIGGTKLQNEINKLYDLSESDDYVKSMTHMALIGGLFAMKENAGKVFKGKLPQSQQNEIDYLAARYAPEVAAKEIEHLRYKGVLTQQEADAQLKKLLTFKEISDMFPDAEFDQVEKIYPLWVESNNLYEKSKNASSEIKKALHGQIDDIQKKILIESGMPLSSEESFELKQLQIKEGEGKDIDNSRLRYLEQREEKANEIKQKRKELPKTEKDDTENKSGLPSEKRIVEEPIQAESEQGTGAEAVSPSGSLEGNQQAEQIAEPLKDVESTAKALESITPNESEKIFYHATDGNDIIAPTDEQYRKREGKNAVNQGIYFGKDKQHLLDRFGDNLFKVVLNIKNPLVTDNIYVDIDGKIIDIRSLSKEDIDLLKSNGYDSVQYKSADENYSSWDETVVFDKSQITKIDQNTSEAYHRAKADGSNPELVKAVEELLGQPKQVAETETKVETPSENIAEKGVDEVGSGGVWEDVEDTFENREAIEYNLKDLGSDVYYHGSDDISYLNSKQDLNTASNTKNAESKYVNLTPKAGTAVSYSIRQQKIGEKSGVAAFKLKGKGYTMTNADIKTLKSNADYEAFYDKKKSEGYDYVKVPQDANDIVVLNNNAIDYVGKKLNREAVEQSLKEQPKATKPEAPKAEMVKETKKDADGNQIGSKSYTENAPNQLVGREREKVIADGTKIKGTYKIVSADDVLASHNEETFAKTEGYPTKDGKTINDRDYEKDKNAQGEVVRIANEIDQRAVAQTPIVTKDGIVVDGNNRTMSRKLSAKQGTDKAYLEALEAEADMYGIDPAEIGKVKNPMLVFEASEDLPYTTETLARFNKAEKKEKSTIEKAVEISKTISDRVKSIINGIYDGAEIPSDVTSSKELMSEIKNALIDSKIWQPNEVAKYINQETGTATKSGVEFLETLLMGSALDENTIRKLSAEGMGNARNMILKAIVPLTKNSAMGENSLVPNITKGIELLNKAKNAKTSVRAMVNQLSMFEQSEYSAEDLALATLLESGGLKKFLNNYNEKVGQKGLFGEITKEGEIDEFLKNQINDYEQIRGNLRVNDQRAKEELPSNDGDGKREPEKEKEKTEPKERGEGRERAETKEQQPDEKAGQGEVDEIVGKTVSFTHAGGKVSGKVTEVDESGKLKVVGKDGTKYKVNKKDADVVGQTEQHFENIAGSQPNTQTGRIPVAPIIGVKPKPIDEIIFDVTKSIKQRLFYAKTGKYAGTYSPGNSAIKIKYNNNLDVFAHELGHSIDDIFGVLSDLVKTSNLAIEAELMKFAPFGSQPPSGHPNPRAYQMGEGFAEYLRALIANPDQAKIEAPELTKLYESKVSQEYRDAVEAFSNDFRTFAGASGKDKILANTQTQPKKEKSFIADVMAAYKNDTTNEFVFNLVDRLAANFTNPMRAFEKAFDYAKNIKGIGDILPKDDPRITARLLAGINTKVYDVLMNGTRNAKGEVLLSKDGKPKNLAWLLEPLDNTDESTIKSDIDDTMAYMIAERTVELSKKFDRDNVLTGIGGGIFKDIDVAMQALNEFNSGDPQKLARIKEAAERYREFADDLLKYMVDKGRLAKREEDANGNLIGGYDFIKENNLQYVSLQRVMETEPGREIQIPLSGGKNLGSKGEPIKKIEGSSKKIENPYVSLLGQVERTMREADRNDVLRSFRDMIYEQRDMYDGQPKRLSDIGIIGKQGDKNSVTIFVDGKPEHWILQEDVYNAIKGLDSKDFQFHPLITMFPKMLRWSVTNFPVFAARNVVRDYQEMILKSRTGAGIKQYVGAEQDKNNLSFFGGLNAGHYLKSKEDYYSLLESTMKDMAKDKRFVLLDPNNFKKAWTSYTDLLSKSESATRVAEYRSAFEKAKKDGMDDYNASIYAAFQARDLMDFALIGNQMKWINQIIPFSNAAVQGLRRSAIAAKENPATFGARIFAYTILPQVALWLWNHKDEETAEEYESLPAHQRDLFWNFKTGANKWASIPKPFELGLGGSFVDRSMSSVFMDNDAAFDGFFGTVAKSISPVDETNLIPIAPAVTEAIINYDVFRNKAIVPPSENALDLSMRNTETASRLGKALQSGFGIDARKADHVIRGQFSYYGNLALKVSDIGREDSKQKFGIVDLGFFKETPAYNSKEVQDFMEYSQKYGLTKSPYYRYFNQLARDYFNENDSEMKDKKAKELREFAKSTLKQYKDSGMEEIMFERAQMMKEMRSQK